MGDSPLANQFTILFCCSKDQHCLAGSYMARSGDLVVWGPICRRNLIQEEQSQLISMLNILKRACILVIGGDRMVWISEVDGSFSVSSLCDSCWAFCS